MRARVPRHPARAADRILVALAFGVCRLVASFAALGRALTLVVVSPGTLTALRLRGGVWRSLWKTSFARVFHQLVRAVPRLAPAVEIVLLEALPRGDEPCVYALVHSHWNLLLARRAVNAGGPHVLASSRWADRLEGVRVDPGRRGLRRVVGALRTGESAAVMAARLAAAGRVPLVPIAVAISRGRVRIRRGSAILVDPSPEGLARATRALAAFFDAAIREDADVWYRFLPYLARRPADPLSGEDHRPRRRIAQRIPSAR
jgi:hypothetical protein